MLKVVGLLSLQSSCLNKKTRTGLYPIRQNSLIGI